MQRQYDRQRSPWVVPTIFAVGLTAFFAWQLDWLPIHMDAPETGRLIDGDSIELVGQFDDAREFDPADLIDELRAEADIDRDGVSNPFDEFDEFSSVRGITAEEIPFATRAAEERKASTFTAPVPDQPLEPFPPQSEPMASDAIASQSVNDAAAATGRIDTGAGNALADDVERSMAARLTFEGIPNRGDGISTTTETGTSIQQAAAFGTVDDVVRDSAVVTASLTSSTVPHDEPPVTASKSAMATASGGQDFDSLLEHIDLAIAENDYLAAHAALSKIYFQDPARRPEILERIQKTSASIYAAPQPHYVEPYVVQPGDQLSLIAQKYDLPWQYLSRLNRVDERRLQPGKKLKVIRGPFSAVVDLSDYELTIHAHGYYVHRYPVGIGREGTTPLGTFAVAEKLVNPTYYGPDGDVIDGDDPANPLGEYWISIGDGYGIHGTINESSIGQAMSRGCIRMRNADVAEVFDLLTMDSQVMIRR